MKNSNISRMFKSIPILFLVLILMLGSFSSFAESKDLSSSSTAYDRQQNEQKNLLKKITPEVQEKMSGDKELIDVLVYLKEKVNVHEVSKKYRVGKTPYEMDLSSRKAVISELEEKAEITQQGLLNYLEREGRFGKVEEIEPFYIANVVRVKATEEVIKNITKLNEVEKIYPNEIIKIEEPIVNQSLEYLPKDDEIEWNIKRVGAPNVWDKFSIDGTGVVVGIIDTGVDWNNPALKEKWRGYDATTGTIIPEGNWFDPISNTTLPTDIISVPHGTHVCGTVLGQELNGTNAIGVAPGAKWIAAKAFTEKGGTNADILACAEWMLKPGGRAENAPDIVNNSWGGLANTSDWFVDMVESWRAANIFPVFAAGNQKKDEPAPWPGSIQNPSSLPGSFAVAAVDINNKRGSFSKLGPSLFDPKGELIKPEISAPGVNIRSSVVGGYKGGWNGTSMAAPHVSGVAALMKSANKSLKIEEIEDILKNTAIPLTDNIYRESPNMGYGYGIVNAFDAVSKVLGAGTGTIEGKVLMEGEDNEEPSIVHEEIGEVFQGFDVKVVANIEDNIAVTEVKLLVKNVNMTNWKCIPMKLKSGTVREGIYEATIPGDLVIDGGVDYKISANDYGGNISISPKYRLDILFGIRPDEYSNDFEDEINGWEFTGDWQWGEPKLEYVLKPKSGTRIIGTKIDSYDVTQNIISTLTLPPIDLRNVNMKSASLQFFDWYNIANAHKAKIMISIDGGENWAKLKEFSGKTGDWKEEYINLNPYIGNEKLVMIKFIFDTNANKYSGYSIGWFINDMRLVGEDTVPPTIPTGINVRTTTEGVELKWNEVIDQDFKEYNVYRATTSGGKYKKLVSTTKAEYVDIDVTTDTKYYYVVTAVDFAGNESKYSKELEHEYIEIKVIFHTDFEEDSGKFTTGAIEERKNDWEWGIPTSGPKAALTGTKVWATKLSGNYNWDHGGYIDSPTIELPTDVDSVLSVDQWLEVNGYKYQDTVDYANIQISQDDGNTWTILKDNIASLKKWETILIDLATYKGKSIKLRFYLFSNGLMNDPGWYIDSITILSKPSVSEINPTIEKEVVYDTLAMYELGSVLPVDAVVTILETGRSVRTDLATGEFKIKHAAAKAGEAWTLRAVAHGYYPKEIKVPLSEGQVVLRTIHLEPIPIGNIVGKVIDRCDKSPISNATVRLVGEPNVEAVKTDDRGNFIIEGVYAGRYTLKIISSEYYTENIDVNVVGNKDNKVNVSMKKYMGMANEIFYDDGNSDFSKVFVNAGIGFGVRFTPENYGRVRSANIYFVEDNTNAMGNKIGIAVVKFDYKGKIVMLGDLKEITIERGRWNLIDLSEYDIMTDEDFYIVTQQLYPSEESPAIGIDAQNKAKERSYVYNGGDLIPVEEYEIDGGMMIRAVMEYESKYPLVTRNVQLEKSSEDITVKFDLYNTTGKSVNGVTIVKLIDNNGRAYKIVYRPIIISGISQNIEFKLNASEYKNGISEVKVYVWDSLDNMKPLADL